MMTVKDAAQVGISLSSTNVRVVRDVRLYGFESLLGEVGGSLGMFLGVSFVSAYYICLSVFNASLGTKKA